jgi:asparagine N-glycosylation enzyme membrane subunit Stt3
LWSAQNQTPSPPPLDYVLGYGLLLILAFFGVRAAWKRRSIYDVLLIVWIVLTLPMLYAPIPLQRRLALGLHIPIGLLAAWGVTELVRARWPRRVLIGVTLLTSIFLELTLFAGAAGRDPHIYLTTNEYAALQWLEQHASPEAVVLSSPEMGGFVPAFAGQRVVYGHPYETVNARQREQEVKGFFAGTLDRAGLLHEYDVAFIIVGPRERALGQIDPAALPLEETFTAGDVKVYRVTSNQ